MPLGTLTCQLPKWFHSCRKIRQEPWAETDKSQKTSQLWNIGGSLASRIALTFSQVGPTPCLFKSSPMNTIWLIPILHLSLLRVRFLSCNLFSNVKRFLSWSSVVFPCTTMSSTMLVAPGHPAIVCLTMFWYCSGALLIPKLNLL